MPNKKHYQPVCKAVPRLLLNLSTSLHFQCFLPMKPFQNPFLTQIQTILTNSFRRHHKQKEYERLCQVDTETSENNIVENQGLNLLKNAL